jgi:hypothetical protein
MIQEECMKITGKSRLLGLFLALGLLLSACGEAAQSAAEPSPSKTPAAAQTTGAVVPQTTASPQEQTGYGYEIAYGDLALSDGQAAGLFALDGQVYLDVLTDSGSHRACTLDGQTWLDLPEADVLALAPAGDTLWYCLETADGLEAVSSEKQVALENTGSIYPLGMAVGGDGNFYFLLGSSVQIYSASGKLLSDLPLAQGQVPVSIRTLGNGEILLNTWKVSENGVQGGSVALVNTESIGASLTDTATAYSVYGGWDSTALLSGGGNLYTLDTETGDMESLLGWIDCDVDPSAITAVCALDGTEIQVLTTTQTETQRVSLTQVPASELEEKTTITLGLVSLSQGLRDQLTAATVAFNRENSDFRVRLVDYSLYQDGEAMLAQDLGTLDLVVAPWADLDQAQLLDLRTLFDQELGEDTLIQGLSQVLDQENGTVLPLYFTLQTLVGTQAQLGAEPGWTPAEFAAAVLADPDRAVLQYCNAYDTLDALLAADPADYASLLTAAAALPVEDQDLYALAGNQDTAAACLADGTLLLETAEISSLLDLKTLVAQVGQDLVCKGYPTETGNGTLLEIPVGLGISAASEHREEAWELLKKLVADMGDYLRQETLGFPIRQEDFDQMAQETMTGLEGDTLVLWVDGEPVEADAFTQDQVEEFLQLIADNSGLAQTGKSASARAALRQVLESGTDPAEAAKSIQ